MTKEELAKIKERHERDIVNADSSCPTREDRMMLDRRVLLAYVDELQNALREIAFYGTTRPLEMGCGDDGDGHFRRIAYNMISLAANALPGSKKITK